jgi:hypothetical protein
MTSNKLKRQRDLSPDFNAITQAESKKAKISSIQTAVSFLSLPGELRNMIYSLYFCELILIISTNPRAIGYEWFRDQNIQLFLTNRQIYQEASSMLYREIFSESLQRWSQLKYLASKSVLSSQILGSTARFREEHYMITKYSAAIYSAMSVVTTTIGLGRLRSVREAGAALTYHAGAVAHPDGHITGELTYVDTEERKMKIKWVLTGIWGKSYVQVEGSIAALLSILGSELMAQNYGNTGYFGKFSSVL